MILAEITWTVNPYIIKIGTFELPWYGLCFAAGFLLGYPLMAKIFKSEGKPIADLDALLVAMIVSTVIGARMGHYFFYEQALLVQAPGKFLIEMITPPFRGLASHGGAIGILIGLYIYARKRPDQPYLWVTDRIVIPAALGGAFIRFGNLMNHEIVGKPTNVPWGFNFKTQVYQNGAVEWVQENVVRHPAQLYESLSCLVLCAILYFTYQKFKGQIPRGLTTGMFFVWIFGLRFLYEFIKENQESFEDAMSLNMGQILSIPLVLFGMFLIVRSLKNKI